MNWSLIFGVLVGLVVALLVLILYLRWRNGRAARKGRRGEKVVAKVLNSLKKRDYILLNDLLLPTSRDHTSQIDHILVSTRGIFVIETKSLAGRISGSEFGQYWRQNFSSGSRSFYNPLLQNASHVKALRRVLKDIDERFFISVVVFTEAWRLDLKAEDIIIPRRFLPDQHIRRTFIPHERVRRRWWRPRKEVRLDETQIVAPLDELREEIERRRRIIPRNNLREIADRIRNVALEGRQDKRTHKEYAKETARNISREIRQGNCPRCGGRLVIRKGEKGEFAGCENYPSCRFTCSIDRLH